MDTQRQTQTDTTQSQTPSRAASLHSSIHGLLSSFTWSSPSSALPAAPPAPADASDPWSYTAYFDRLSSFTPLDWFAAPSFLSPLYVARFGWRCCGPSRLVCAHAGCHGRLSVELSVEMDEEETNKVAKSYVDKLVSEHASSCPWRSHTSPDTFARLPSEQSVRHSQTQERKDKINTLTSIPGPFNRLDPAFRSEWRAAVSECGCPDELASGVDLPLLLALCGWTANKDSNNLICSFCTQIIEIEEFEHEPTHPTADSSTSDSAVTSSPVPAKRPRLAEKARFNPALDHRYFCAFTPSPTAHTTSAANSEPAGWVSVLRSWVARDRSLNERPASARALAEDALSNARKLILINQ